MRRYRELLTAPGVVRLTAANNLARLSVAMLSLSLLVAVTQAHGYAEVGLLMLVYAVTNAAAGPVRGRLADRYPPRTVLLRLRAGPVLAGGLLLVLPAHVAFAATGVIKLAGDTLAVTSPALPGGRPEAGPTDLVGPLASGPVRLLLTLILLDTFAYGCLEVAAVAAVSGQGSAGVLTAAQGTALALTGKVHA